MRVSVSTGPSARCSSLVWSAFGVAAPEQGYSISAAILSETLVADIFTDSRARWA